MIPRKKTPGFCLNFIKELTGGIQNFFWLGSLLSLIAYCLQNDKSYVVNLLIAIILALFNIVGAFVNVVRFRVHCEWQDATADVLCTTQVKCDGLWKNVQNRNLVPGDVVKVQAGDRVPADIILLETHKMKVDNSTLTGEAEDISRVSNQTEQNIFETPNVVFFGT